MNAQTAAAQARIKRSRSQGRAYQTTQRRPPRSERAWSGSPGSGRAAVEILGAWLDSILRRARTTWCSAARRARAESLDLERPAGLHPDRVPHTARRDHGEREEDGRDHGEEHRAAAERIPAAAHAPDVCQGDGAGWPERSWPHTRAEDPSEKRSFPEQERQRPDVSTAGQRSNRERTTDPSSSGATATASGGRATPRSQRRSAPGHAKACHQPLEADPVLAVADRWDREHRRSTAGTRSQSRGTASAVEHRSPYRRIWACPRSGRARRSPRGATPRDEEDRDRAAALAGSDQLVDCGRSGSTASSPAADGWEHAPRRRRTEEPGM